MRQRRNDKGFEEAGAAVAKVIANATAGKVILICVGAFIVGGVIAVLVFFSTLLF